MYMLCGAQLSILHWPYSEVTWPDDENHCCASNPFSRHVISLQHDIKPYHLIVWWNSHVVAGAVTYPQGYKKLNRIAVFGRLWEAPSGAGPEKQQVTKHKYKVWPLRFPATWSTINVGKTNEHNIACLFWLEWQQKSLDWMLVKRGFSQGFWTTHGIAYVNN